MKHDTIKQEMPVQTKRHSDPGSGSGMEPVEHDVVATNSAILLAVASNSLITLILFGVIRRKSRYLQFPATLRSFQTPSSERRERERT